MKKSVISVLAILLTLAMILGFAACGPAKDPDPTEPTTIEDITAGTDEPTEPVALPGPGDDLTEPEPTSEEPTTDPDATTVPGETTTEGPATTLVPGQTAPPTTVPVTTAKPTGTDYTPPANLGSLSNAEKLAYFNLVAQRVRTEKPGFDWATLKVIDKIKLSGFAAIANPIIEIVKKQLMPGEWEYDNDVAPGTRARGTGNDGKFLSENMAASGLSVGDITSITAVKSGNNWVIKVVVKSETNPAKGGRSANSRLNCIATRDEVLKAITDISDAIKADVNNATLQYHDGYATLTVDPQGRVVASESGFFIDATANDVTIGPIKTNVTAPQSTVVKCTNFKW